MYVNRNRLLVFLILRSNSYIWIMDCIAVTSSSLIRISADKGIAISEVTVHGK